jgi:hypothetical protein
MALTLVTSDLIHGLDYSKLTGTITTWNQDTTGNAATATLAAGATILATARNIGGVSFNGSAAIDLPGVNTAGNQNTSGVAATATLLATARTIGGVSFNGSTSINLPGVNIAGNQDTSGNAGSVTNGVYTVGNQTIGGTKTFSSAATFQLSALTNPSGVDANTVLTIKNNGWSGITMLSSAATGSFLTFGDADAGFRGRIQYLQGSTDAMLFETAASEKMRISSEGDVGIGNTHTGGNGNGGLVVTKVGNGVFANTSQKRVASFYADSGGNNNPGVILGYDNSTSPNGIIAARTQSGSGTLPGLQFFTYNGSSWGPRLTISSGGNILIGNPSVNHNYNLQIEGNNILLNTEGSSQLKSIYARYSNEFRIQCDSFMTFYTDGSPTEKMRITSGGRVLINTTTLSDGKLAIDTATSTAYNPTAYNGGNANIRLTNGSAGVNRYTGISFGGGGSTEAFIGSVQNSSNLAEIVFQTYNGSAYGERMRIASNGAATLTPSQNGDSLTINNTGTYAGTIAFNQNGTNTGYVGSIRAFEGSGTADNGVGLYSRTRMSFYINSPTPSLTIAADGKVTIQQGLTVGTDNTLVGSNYIKGDVYRPGAGSYMERIFDIQASSSGSSWIFAKQLHDHANWGGGNINVIIQGTYPGVDQFFKGDFTCRYGYGGGSAYITTNFNGGVPAPTWQSAVNVSGNVHYRNLVFAGPAYQRFTVRIILTGGLVLTSDSNASTSNVVWIPNF